MAYFSNGSEGEILDNQCADCPVGQHPDAPCPVLLVQFEYNYDQIGNKDLREAMNLLINEKGICQMRKVMRKFGDKPEVARIDPRNVLPGMEKFAKQAGLI